MTLVTRLVKSVTLPMTFCEKVCTPLATDEAKSDPGRRGTEGIEAGVEGMLLEAGADRG